MQEKGYSNGEVQNKEQEGLASWRRQRAPNVSFEFEFEKPRVPFSVGGNVWTVGGNVYCETKCENPVL